MLQNPFNLAIWLLISGLAGVTFSMHLYAMSNSASHARLIIAPTIASPVAKQPEEFSQRHTSISPMTTGTGSTTGEESRPTETSSNIPCLHGSSKDIPADTNTEVNPCTESSADQYSASAQFGHHTGSRSGILGEFDGFRLDYRLNNSLLLNGVIGYPVLSSQDKFNTARQVYGVSAGTGKIASSWDINSYLIALQEHGRTASRSIGGAFRYLQPERSLMFLIDYDVAKNSIAALTTSGVYMLPSHTTISATIDIRKNPIHTRYKKYLQQNMDSTDGWTWDLPEDRIAHFIYNGAYKVTTLAFSLSHMFSHNLKMSSNIAVVGILDEPEIAEASDKSAQPDEQFYQLKISGNNMLINGDSNKLELYYRSTESSQITTLSIDAKYAVTRFWNINPRVHTEQHNERSSSAVSWKTKPAINMEFRARNNSSVKIEAGGEWSIEELPNEEINLFSYYVSLGYRTSF